MTVVQAMNEKLGEWCVFPWIQEHSLFVCPFGRSISQISYLLMLFISFQSSTNRKAQPDYIRTGAPALAQGFPFAFYPQNSYSCPWISIYYLDDEPKSLWNGNVFWLWIRVVLLVILGSQEKVSGKTNKRFRANVQGGIVESERYRKLQQRKIIAKKNAKITDFIKHRKVQEMWIQ